jgi:uncharacterized membrane protein
MFLNDFYSVIQWWSVIFLLGIGFLPLTFFIFNKFFDRGYIFSKLLALSFTGYIVLLLGLSHLAPFKTFTIFAVFLLLSILIYYLFRKQKILHTLKTLWPIFVLEEILFFLALTFWAFIHGFGPDIHGLEKYMDYGFINSILRTDYLPPKDMWLTPGTINYYYFGHFLTALLTKISFLQPNITFNLMLSTIFAFCFVQTFSIGANLFVILKQKTHLPKIKLLVSGFITAFLVTFSGNLHILYAFFKPYQNENVVPMWTLPFNPLEFPNSYWYPNATRFIYNTIHEFPIYSWVVADLHGHVLDIPFVLLTIAILFSLLLRTQEVIENFKLKIGYLVLLSFLLAVMYMTNAWDGAIYLLLTGLILLYISYKSTSKFLPLARNFIFSISIIPILFTLFSLPYNMFFKPFVSGIGVLCAPNFLIEKGKIGPLLFEANHCQHSQWWEILTLYGFFYFFALSFLFFINKLKKLMITDIFVLFLILLSTFLIILPEFIYVKDIYPAHYRANTMFKLVFQGFIMLSISAGYIIVRILSSFRLRELSIFKKLFALSYVLLTVALLSLVLTYPYIAIKSYYNELSAYKGLDGTAYLNLIYPSDYNAIRWLNRNILGQPVILEAQGDSYTDYARVSSNTGLPTILGWTVHEWLWRGSYDVPAPRINEVKTLYESRDKRETLTLLNKYDIEYVFIGNLEYQKYPTLDEGKFSDLGMIIFRDGDTKIYKIKK